MCMGIRYDSFSETSWVELDGEDAKANAQRKHAHTHSLIAVFATNRSFFNFNYFFPQLYRTLCV